MECWGWSPAGISSHPHRVPALPVKNLNGTGPVHPALAGKTQPSEALPTSLMIPTTLVNL